MSQKSPKKSSNYGTDVSFADVSLNQADKDAFSNWMSGVKEDYEDWLEAAINDSYRISFKFDYNNNCVSCVFTQQDNKHVNSGLVIISRSDNPVEAFWLTVYKVWVLFEGQRLPVREDSASWG